MYDNQTKKTNYGELNLLTPNEAAKEERNRLICDDYTQMKDTVRPWRIFAALARKYEMTVTNIYYIVSSNGLYKPRG